VTATHSTAPHVYSAERAHGRFSRDLTVVIVSYNCVDLLRSCLTSLEGQSTGGELRVVVVDNASSDGTVEMVVDEFPGVELIANEDNVGFGRASNAGLRRVRSGHVLMLNPDTVVPPNGLHRALDALRDRPSAGILGVRLVQLDGTVDHASRRQIPTPVSSFGYLFRLPGRAARAYTDPTSFDTEGVVGAVNGAFMLMRDEVVLTVGGFDEAFWMYGEDLDLCLRVTQAGWDVHYWPGVEVLHVKGGSSGKARRPRVNWAFHHAMWLFYRKHFTSVYNPVVTALVAGGIATKFFLSLTRNALVRTISHAH
jgi:GT2 family glycosyltransferase